MTSEPLVALDGIRVQFPIGRRTLTAVEGVNLYIDPGETLALVGESGSGKSTIGNVIAGLQRPTAGTMRFRGQLLDKASARSAQRAIQIIFQDPFGALDPRMPVSAIIAEPLLIQRVGSGRERAARAADLVDQVGLPRDALNRYPHRILRRPAPAHRDRPRACPGACSDRRRRTAVGAGRLDPEPDPQSARGATTGAWPRLPVHQPRPRGGQSSRRPGCGAVSRAFGRGGSARKTVRHPVAPVHDGFAGGDAAHRPPPPACRRYPRRDAQPARPATGLRLPHALPEGAGYLPGGTTASGTRARQAHAACRVPL